MGFSGLQLELSFLTQRSSFAEILSWHLASVGWKPSAYAEFRILTSNFIKAQYLSLLLASK